VDRRGVTSAAAAAVAAITVSGVTDFIALGKKWRDLETRSTPSFFQSWTWTGCLAEERFLNPVLVEAREDGRTVALALFNRRGRTLYLGESGDPALDSIYIEFNGVLAETGRENVLSIACLRAARVGFGGWTRKARLILSGVPAETAIAAGEVGAIRQNKSLSCPLVDLTGNDQLFLDARSANTRQQLRRSDRGYASSGAITVERAETKAQAFEFLDELITLHQASWTARGKPGAFANSFFSRFHRALISRALTRGEVDLLRIAAGPQVIGYLYNFRYRGHSLAYQSGFDYDGSERHGKPGMTCHHAAIQYAMQWGAARYDFLAGDDRYKRSLSDRAETLHWIEVADPWSPRFLVRRALDFAIAVRRGGRGEALRPSADFKASGGS
jgi:CelD/BcsL family acetyltransferase involved in cellulose biosynthesis